MIRYKVVEEKETLYLIKSGISYIQPKLLNGG